jgi:hypothetical protein
MVLTAHLYRMSEAQLQAHVYTQFLHSNLKHSAAKSLPPGVTEMAKTTLHGIHIVQVRAYL